MKKEDEMKKTEISEDVWIKTQCHRCMSNCSLQARRVNGTVVQLEGIPDSPNGAMGGLCPKGLAELQVLYDPNRLNVPLRRTNQEKGLGVDPRWKEITWEEALDEITSKLKTTMDDDPRKIMIQHGITPSNMIVHLFLGPLLTGLSTPKGTPSISVSSAAHCGNSGHFINALNYAAFVIGPDWKYTKYMIVFGTNSAFGGFQMWANRLAAEALEHGMKLVVFDPVCGNAASHATEWIPITPGTDGAVALAMLNVIVNELGICDIEYLKHKTNAPYLIKPDGHYLRDETTNKPMVWDNLASKAKTFDDPSIGDYDIDNKHEVDGVNCQPSWISFKENLKKHTPERSSDISGVPATTIRRIATEYAKAASIGTTITIDGKQLPYRPVATYNIRAAGAHGNGTHTIFAIDMLHHVVGAAGVPGSTITVSIECFGHPETKRPYMGVKACPDGFVTIGGRWLFPDRFWPPREPVAPRNALGELFPLALDIPLWGIADRDEVLIKTKLNSQIDVLINYCTNGVMNSGRPYDKGEFLKRVPFIIDFELFPTEFNEGFADIVLPSTCFLEYSEFTGVLHSYHNQSLALDEPWATHITQKVIEPLYQRRYAPEVVIDILDRIGVRDRVNGYYNHILELDDSEQLKPGQKIIWEELCDKAVTHYYGLEHNWEWFKKHGFISWPKKVEEVYWRHFKDIRVQIYWEYMLDMKEKTQKIVNELGLPINMEHYLPLPDWFPIAPHFVSDSQYDLYCFSWADSTHQATCTQEQPWLDEASRMNPYTYFIIMNAKTAEKKGLKVGDRIEIESSRGNKVNGVLQVRKGQHPQTVTIMGCAGHWAKGQPIAKGKGVNMNSLIEIHLAECDPITMSIEPCVKVKVSRLK
ncbi:MAG: molybdopterin-dependent oxidoreductase [Dehalococcoidales bacterium]|nr:molybdopterin-dependent oxidoreductase [Dehalococcoidales bacterium]